MIVLNVPDESRCKTKAGFSGINSSAGWIWDRRARGDSLTPVRPATGDLEGWPLRNDISPRVENIGGAICSGNALELVRTPTDGEDFARGVQELDAYFEINGVIDTQARTASYVVAWSP